MAAAKLVEAQKKSLGQLLKFLSTTVYSHRNSQARFCRSRSPKEVTLRGLGPNENLLGFISIRVARFFTLARQAYHNPPPLPRLGTKNLSVIEAKSKCLFFCQRRNYIPPSDVSKYYINLTITSVEKSDSYLLFWWWCKEARWSSA